MLHVYQDDLSDFIRHGKLDAYELTNDELDCFLEVWRWSALTRRNDPTAPDHDTHDLVFRLERHLKRKYGIEVEYNTRLLLQSEIEPVMHLNVLLSVRHALLYFLRHPLALFRAHEAVRRCEGVRPVRGQQTFEGNGYPAPMRVQPPRVDVLKRRYWRRLDDSTVEEREKHWW